MSRPILTVGPRILPGSGVVRVWIDNGSGSGYMREVATSRLSLAATDDGEGSSAVYLLHPPSARSPCRDRPGQGGRSSMNKETVDLTGAEWFKSSRSGAAGHCVEIAFVGQATAVRDSTNPDGPALVFAPAEWDAFVGGAKGGEFDRT